MKYTITGEGIETQSRSDKGAAVKIADELRSEHKVTVQVTTDKGTVVHEAKARKQGKATERFTRVDEREVKALLGEGVKVPRNYDVAYLRPRAGYALLRKVTQEGTSYLVFNLASGETEGVESTRAGGARMIALSKSVVEAVA